MAHGREQALRPRELAWQRLVAQQAAEQCFDLGRGGSEPMGEVVGTGIHGGPN